MTHQYHKILRYSCLTLTTFTSLSSLSSRSWNQCESNNTKNTTWIFDPKGFPTHIHSFGPSSEKWSQPLILSAVGMRKKNLYLFDVDVYMTGLNLLPEIIENLQSNSSLKPSNAIIHTQQQSLNFNDQQGQQGQQPVATITCHFVRDVGLDSILDAFQQTFAGLPSNDILEFRQQLSLAVGPNGVKKDDKVIFAWLSKGGMKILLNGIVGSSLYNPLVEERLIEIYVDEKRTVSPQLVRSFYENISKIPTK